jgi:hypothetical protein
MPSDNYLNQIINKYAVNEAGAKLQALAIRPAIQRWAQQYLLETIFSGSIAKGTAILLCTDADVFISLSSITPGTLAHMYETLFTALNHAGLQPRRQNVSIGVTSGGFKIDLVPGKRQSQFGYDHSIYKNKAHSWTQTNVKTHIDYVKNSNRTKEIKLTKIWRQLNRLDFPSFYLEMAIIDFLAGRSTTDLSGNFWEALGFLAGNFLNRRYIDPANTNNVISDDLTNTEKQLVQSAAQASRRQTNWEQIVW